MTPLTCSFCPLRKELLLVRNRQLNLSKLCSIWGEYNSLYLIWCSIRICSFSSAISVILSFILSWRKTMFKYDLVIIPPVLRGTLVLGKRCFAPTSHVLPLLEPLYVGRLCALHFQFGRSPSISPFFYLSRSEDCLGSRPAPGSVFQVSPGVGRWKIASPLWWRVTPKKS